MASPALRAPLAGADAWAYGIRSRMATDPARANLFDEIQTGFLWIDEYLAGIEQFGVSGANNATYVNEARVVDRIADFEGIRSLCELIKTPGRNKGTVKKTRAALQQVQAAEEKLKAINAPRFDTSVRTLLCV